MKNSSERVQFFFFFKLGSYTYTPKRITARAKVVYKGATDAIKKISEDVENILWKKNMQTLLACVVIITILQEAPQGEKVTFQWNCHRVQVYKMGQNIESFVFAKLVQCILRIIMWDER